VTNLQNILIHVQKVDSAMRNYSYARATLQKDSESIRIRFEIWEWTSLLPVLINK